MRGNDLEQVRTLLAPMLGLETWGAKLGVGTFITSNFVDRVTRMVRVSSPGGIATGAWVRLEQRA